MTTRKKVPKQAIDDLLVRSRRRCAFCYLEGDSAPKTGNIAHIMPSSHGGKETADNLIFLCQHHHAELDRREGTGPTIAEIKTAKDKLYKAISKETESSPTTRPKVFIVHGHDDSTVHALKQFLNDNDIAPVVLNEQPNFGMTILEKIEQNADADYALAVLNPSDTDSRARQNVILELGYFLGRLGRNRVCVITTPGVEVPTDVHGILYIEKDKRGRWKKILERELKEAGLSGRRNDRRPNKTNPE